MNGKEVNGCRDMAKRESQRRKKPGRGSTKHQGERWKEVAGEELALLSAGRPLGVFTLRGILAIILCISHSVISTIKTIVNGHPVTTEHPS